MGNPPAVTVYSHPHWAHLAHYCGAQFRPEWCNSFDAKVTEAYAACSDPAAFYQTTEVYLYQNTGFTLDGYKRPYYGILFQLIGGDQVSVLDYGCGCGYDGQWFAEAGLQVSFADMPCVGLDYLRWRLQAQGYGALPIYSLFNGMAIPQHDVVWCIDVLEHLPPAAQRSLLLTLEQLGRTVLVNLVHDAKADQRIHFPVDTEGLTAWVASRRRCWWQEFHAQPDGSGARLLVIGERAHRLAPSASMAQPPAPARSVAAPSRPHADEEDSMTYARAMGLA
jgi:hypothetical protein